jgi:hypothetical protein
MIFDCFLLLFDVSSVDDPDVRDGEDADGSVALALEPVGVDATPDVNHFAFLQSQFPRILSLQDETLQITRDQEVKMSKLLIKMSKLLIKMSKLINKNVKIVMKHMSTK